MISLRRRVLLVALFCGGMSLGGWLMLKLATPHRREDFSNDDPSATGASQAVTSAVLAPVREPKDAPSPLADQLLSSRSTGRDDVRIVGEILDTWRTNFPNLGNPVGDNREITLALTGRNALDFAFIPPGHRAISAGGELHDRWGTPFRLHALSGTRMEVWSAGPDRRFATEDDIRSED
ncbi:MAG: hypothetical protein SFV32_06565 [Opitutaceae bacterium]|nr:hypothetical protein [Opitutaceae bacterium]